MRQTAILLLLIAAVATGIWWVAGGSSGPGATLPQRPGPTSSGSAAVGGDVAIEDGDRTARAKASAAVSEQRVQERKLARGVVLRGQLRGPSVDWSEVDVQIAKARPDFSASISVVMRQGFSNINDPEVSKRLRKSFEDPEVVASARAHGDGRFEIRTDYVGAVEFHVKHPLLRVAKPPRAMTTAAELERSAQKDVGVVQCSLAASLIVIVQDARGRAVRDAAVKLGRAFNPFSVVDMTGQGKLNFDALLATLRKIEAKTDERGIARLSGQLPLDAGRLVVQAEGHGPAIRSLRLDQGKESIVTVQLPSPAILRLSILDEDEAPVVNARISVERIRDDEVGTRVLSGDWSSPRGVSDAKGFAEIGSLPAGACRVRVRARGYLPLDREVRLEAGHVDEREYVLERGARLEGVVVDVEGQPVEGAHVGSMQNLGQAVMGIDLSSFVPDVAKGVAARANGVRSAKDGSFALSGLIAGEQIQLVVAKDGFATKSLKVRSGARDLRVEVERMGSVTGRVLREEDKAPLEDFSVKSLRKRFLVLELKEGQCKLEGDGRFSLVGLQPGLRTVSVEAPGRAPKRVVVKIAKSGKGLHADVGEVVLSPPSSVEGFVRDADGQPVVGAKVRVAKGGTGDMKMLAELRGDEIAKTDDKGYFLLSGLPARRMRMRVDAEGYAPKRSKTVRVERGSRAGPLEIVVDKGLTVAGRVVDAKDRPLAGWFVQLQSNSLGISRALTTGADGLVRFDFVAPGVYTVEGVPRKLFEEMMPNASRANASQIGKFIGKALSSSVSKRLDVQGKPGSTVSFKLTSRSAAATSGNGTARVLGGVRVGGKPLPNGIVEFQLLGATNQDFAMIREGRYSIEGLAAGKYRVRLRSGLLRSGVDGGRVVSVPRSGEARCDLELGGGSIRGQVFTASGTPASFVLVRIKLHDQSRRFDPGEIVELGRGMSLTDKSGRFTFDGLAAGRYSVVARQLGGEDGMRSARSREINLGVGQKVEGTRIKLQRGASLALVVRGPDAAPIVGARVRALDSRGVPLASFQLAKTDASGEAVLRGFAPGVYRVVVESAEHANKLSEVFAVSAEQEASLILRLEAGVMVTARFRGELPPGAVGSAASYSIWTEKGEYVRSGFVRVPALQAKGQQSASIPLGRLAPGSYVACIETAQLGVLEQRRKVPARGSCVWTFDATSATKKR